MIEILINDYNLFFKKMDQYLELTKRNDNIIHISLNEM